MGFEIEHSEIETLPNSLALAERVRARSEWIRAEASQLGLDGEKLLLGEVLSSIVDDSNYFAWSLYLESFDPELAEQSRETLLVRLKWEIDTPELPDKIRKRLKKVRKALKSSNWSDQESFNKGKKTWDQKVKEWVEDQIRKEPDFGKAIGYLLENSIILGKLDERERTIHQTARENAQD